MSSDLSKAIRAGKPRPMRKWLIISIILVAIVAILLFLKNRSDNADTSPTFVTEPLHKGDLSVTITATGNLKPTNQVTVGSELSGTVLEVFVEINDQVTKGQKLARLDTSKLLQQTESSRANLASAKAKVSQAEATVRETKANLARLEDLHRISGGKTPSKAELDSATATSDRALADLESARASVSQNEAAVLANESDLGKAIISSPVDGVVLIRTIEPGQTVAAQFTAPELFVIAENLQTMELLVAVAEADIGKVADEQPATFTVDAWPERSYNAKVERVSFGSTITDNVVTYDTELSVPNEDLSLRPGMTATVDIEIGSREGVLLVSTAALRFKPVDPSKLSDPAEKKSIVQSLIPGSSRRRGGNRPPAGGPPERRKPGKAQIWILKSGKPIAISVKTGLSDGRVTEISGESLSEGAPIILRQTTGETPGS